MTNNLEKIGETARKLSRVFSEKITVDFDYTNNEVLFTFRDHGVMVNSMFIDDDAMNSNRIARHVGIEFVNAYLGERNGF